MYKLVDATELHHEMSGKAIVDDSNGHWFTTYEDYNDFPKSHRDFIDRELACTNALSGIPDAWLKDAKKAIVFYKMQELLFNTGRLDVAPSESVEAGIRLHQRNRDYFPTELHVLIDSFKE